MLFSRHDVAHFAHQLYAQKLLSLQASELHLQLPIHVFRCRLIPAVALTQAEYFLSHHNVLEYKRKERPEEMDLVMDDCLIFAIYPRLVTVLIKQTKFVVFIFLNPRAIPS